ncbi:uncharacterized protein LOC103391489 isoform X2 [Cynoglossus semilaevis]|uniref:uncharacterized protein LOC103391489 isoform X2 n=1 Tax=Cynoglossus semilaevis TaxID=244447 RepID=UPI000D62D018|nr:uncharacterized protein LOC103391489 isoform X2 [Cynoglossus semilaevis]
MSSLNRAFYLLCLLLGEMTLITATVDQQNVRLISAIVGEDLTLACVVDHSDVQFFWYRQRLGRKPQIICSVYSFQEVAKFHHEFKDNPRFRLEKKDDQMNLRIADAQPTDSATYFCMSGRDVVMEFKEAITVRVEKSRLTVHSVVHQPQFENFQPGGSVNLSCTVHPGSCDGEHSVYWFLSSGEHQPGLLYTSGGRSDQCEKKPNTQTHTCVYNLPLNISNSGTYYCAVASCGHILFGKGTKVESQDEVNLTYLMYAALTFTSILSVFLSVLLVKRNKENCCKCSDSTREISAPSTTNEEGYGDEENLHYAALSVHNRTRRRMDNVENDCVYSSVRH